MATSPRGADRRTHRTHQALRQASIEVVRAKGFKATRVRDITERANVNRSTFYAHFVDKYELTDALIRDDFRDTVVSHLPPVTQWENTTVRQLVRILLERAGNSRHFCRDADLLRPRIQHVARQELATLLLTWLRRIPATGNHWRVPPATVADLASWMILGAVCQWRQSAEPDMTAEQLAGHVQSMVMDGVAGARAAG